MEVRKFKASKKYRKSHNDINISPRFDYNFYKRTPKYNPRVLIGNWYEETNILKNRDHHFQTEYQRQFSTKLMPQIRRLSKENGISKQFRNGGSSFKKKYLDDHYLSTYDVSYQCIPNLQENYSKSDIFIENAETTDHGNKTFSEVDILQSETDHLDEDYC
ncbi:uncharacterized protein LOC130894002 [Diorhabda carinulata]|uniref:uncharacterized protein LOC130894002 n=1 Tax=Diorhabda carinulata TaxID=1163345 RepID=UPI0025A16C9D|nr:uncharacterized protein LOC130894002 [Diorhabda carinulata]